MNQPYQPISCSFYDELEVWAMRKTLCSIVFRDANDVPQTIKTTIADVFANNGEEFIKLADGQLIRLDRLINVNGNDLPQSC